MLSEKLINHLKSKKRWNEEKSEDYSKPIQSLGVKTGSAFDLFFSHVADGPTFLNRRHELYHISWFILNTDYLESLKIIQNGLSLPQSFLPLDSFEAEYGFFYDIDTDEVIELELGEKLKNFHKGIIDTKWNSFNDFLEWYYEIN